MDQSDNGAAPAPDQVVKFQVAVVINGLDQLAVIAPGLPLDRVAVILRRAHDWCALEMIAQRTAEVIAERDRRIAIPGGPVRLPPPPGR